MKQNNKKSVSVKMKWMRGALIAAVCLGLTALVVAWFIHSIVSSLAPVRQASNTFMHDIISNDATAAYGLTTSNFQQSTNESTFAASVQHISQAAQGQPEITGTSANSYAASNGTTSTGKVSFSLPSKNGVGTVILTLLKVNGRWLVDTENTSVNLE